MLKIRNQDVLNGHDKHWLTYDSLSFINVGLDFCDWFGDIIVYKCQRFQSWPMQVDILWDRGRKGVKDESWECLFGVDEV